MARSDKFRARSDKFWARSDNICLKKATGLALEGS